MLSKRLTLPGQKKCKQLLGRDGGNLKDIVDVAIIVPSNPSNITARIQEAHIFILHYFCEGLE